MTAQKKKTKKIFAMKKSFELLIVVIKYHTEQRKNWNETIFIVHRVLVSSPLVDGVLLYSNTTFYLPADAMIEDNWKKMLKSRLVTTSQYVPD